VFSANETGTVFVIILAAVFGATVWLIVSSLMGLPTSSTHSIVGAVAFAAIAAKGDILVWTEIGKIVGSWFLSPLLGAVACCAL